MEPSDQNTPPALQHFDPKPETFYSIEAVAQMTQTPRHHIAVYCRHGLISPVVPPERDGWLFNDETIRTLRYIEHLRAEYDVNLPGLRMISELLGEIEQLREEVRFLRGR
jgi:DNA-binding transcriptional MerR regulator